MACFSKKSFTRQLLMEELLSVKRILKARQCFSKDTLFFYRIEVFRYNVAKKARLIMKNNRLIHFLGGKTSYYVLGLIILSAVAVFLLNQISFLFTPFSAILTAIIPPFLFGLILYYLFNPVVDKLESKKIPRSVSIAGIYLLILLYF